MSFLTRDVTFELTRMGIYTGITSSKYPSVMILSTLWFDDLSGTKPRFSTVVQDDGNEEIMDDINQCGPTVV